MFYLLCFLCLDRAEIISTFKDNQRECEKVYIVDLPHSPHIDVAQVNPALSL